jgi:hypothetical protein
VREQFFLAAAAQNIKRRVRFLNQPTNPVVSVTEAREENFDDDACRQKQLIADVLFQQPQAISLRTRIESASFPLPRHAARARRAPDKNGTPQFWSGAQER